MLRHQTPSESDHHLPYDHLDRLPDRPYHLALALLGIGLLFIGCGDAGDYAADSDRLEATEALELSETQADVAPPGPNPTERPVLDLSAGAVSEDQPVQEQPTSTVEPMVNASSNIVPLPSNSSVEVPSTTTLPTPLPSETALDTQPTTQTITQEVLQSEAPTSVATTTPVSTTASPPVADDATPAQEAPVQPQPPETNPPAAAVSATPEPNCAVMCNIAMEGDSLTVGLGNRLCGAVQTGRCINSGIVGRRVDEMIVTARTDVDNIVGADNNDVIILWAGTNDLWQKYHSTNPTENAAAVYENIKTFVSERRASGWDQVFVMTLPPMNQQYVVGTEDLNALIRQNAAAADGVIDVGADPRLANEFDRAMRAADGIHFGDGGRAVVMEHILPAIHGLDGA